MELSSFTIALGTTVAAGFAVVMHFSSKVSDLKQENLRLKGKLRNVDEELRQERSDSFRTQSNLYNRIREWQYLTTKAQASADRYKKLYEDLVRQQEEAKKRSFTVDEQACTEDSMEAARKRRTERKEEKEERRKHEFTERMLLLKDEQLFGLVIGKYNKKQLRQVYKRAMQKFHPDKFGGDGRLAQHIADVFEKLNKQFTDLEN